MLDALKHKIHRNGLLSLSPGEMQLAAAFGLSEDSVRQDYIVAARAETSARLDSTTRLIRPVPGNGGSVAVRRYRESLAA